MKRAQIVASALSLCQQQFARRAVILEAEREGERNSFGLDLGREYNTICDNRILDT